VTSFFPGFPIAAGQDSTRIAFSSSLRSTLDRNLVNEARVGASGAPVQFFKQMTVDMLNGSVANTRGVPAETSRPSDPP
jgi:hypothetical protein